MTKSNPTSPVSTWTQEEAISYECASEAITHAMAIISAEIDEVEGRDSGNHHRLRKLDDLQAQMAVEQASLYELDTNAILAIRAKYGSIVRAGRQGIRQAVA